jgi:hypothetical protein
MRLTIEAPDTLGPRAIRNHRTPRQQAEYMLTKALRELEDQERRQSDRREPEHRTSGESR